MKKTILLTIGFWLAICIGSFAQEDAHLRKMTDDLISLRKARASVKACEMVELSWSTSECPKITLMDDLKKDKDNEYTGKGFNKFKMNQIVTNVYSRQNVGMVSKGEYFSSTEKDVYYSGIEKTIKPGCTATYTLKGHVGTQEIVFVLYNPNAKILTKVNRKAAQLVKGKLGVYSLMLPAVKNEDAIVITITNDSESNESVVILIHNPQK